MLKKADDLWFEFSVILKRIRLNVTNTLLFPQVSSLHRLQVFTTLPSSFMLEENTRQSCTCSRTMNSWSRPTITSQNLTQLIMEETQCSCSCSRETKCTWDWLQTVTFGDTIIIQLSAVSWFLKCKKLMLCLFFHYCLKMNVTIIK